MRRPLLAPMALCGLLSADNGYAQAFPLDQPLRAIHIAGNWGTNRQTVEAWDPESGHPLVPPDHIEHLRDLHVNWVGLSVALHYDDSMDSTVERLYSRGLAVPTFSDEVLRQLIREFRNNDFDVYLTLAFESQEAYGSARPAQRWQLGDPGDPVTGVPDGSRILPEHWPWRPSHPEHHRFVREFFETYTEQAVHFAKIAQQEGVRMYSLGTATERLFRTRPSHLWQSWTNDFRQQLEAMVRRVRFEYHGLLTYDMYYDSITNPWTPWFAGSKYLWEDLDLDVVGVSAWFPLSESAPSTVTGVETLRGEYERIFDTHLVPLARRNEGRPVVFTEYGSVDLVEAPFRPRGYDFVEHVDSNNNGVDDGHETQANIFQALFETMDRFPGVVHGAFFWDNGIASDELWTSEVEGRRGFDIRNKPAGEVVRARYYRLRAAENSWVYAVGTLPDRTLYSGTVATAIVVPAGNVFRNALTYRASSSAADVATVRVSGATVTVTAVAEGRAIITVMASGADDSTATLRFRVTVADFQKLRRRIEALRTRERER